MIENKIIGVCLVKNEENFVGWALNNVAHFCDEILVMDNQSSDRTRGILEALAVRHSHLRVMTVSDANKTHALVEQWAGQNVWVFGIDGDEIYDKVGLSRLRKRILSGEFNAYWRLFGHTIHARDLNLDAGRVAGYTTPDARSISKLYNFAGISSWHQPNHERLHGKDMVFRPGYHWGHAYNFWEHEAWDQSDFRCLHLCFAPRSSLDGSGDPRNNPVDVKKAGRIVKRLTSGLVRLLDPAYDIKKNYKYKHYAVGEIVSEALAGFGRPSELGELSPLSVELESMFGGNAWLPAALR